MIVLNIISLLLLDSDVSWYSILTSLLYLFGLAGIFRKCGVEPWWAFVPIARYYKLAQCADRLPEGRIYVVTQVLTDLTAIGQLFIPEESTLGNIYALASLVIFIPNIIYEVRICLGLIENFGKRKAWAWLWMLISWLPAMLWGWGKKYQPRWKVEAMKAGDESYFSGTKAVVMDDGLTVNLEKRTVREFLQLHTLLRDIHMYIRPGHMVLLLGGSGAGKTTFLNAVNGYEKADAEIILNGRNMYTEYKDMLYDIGFVPQQDLMRDSDTVLRTLMDASALRLPLTLSRAQRRERVDEVMKVFGLTPVQDSQVVKLSGGQRKRLSIAMEFISNPSLFILDEPDSGLDGVMARELFTQLRGIANQGKIIMVITHTPDRVIDLFDDVIVLAKDADRTGRLAYFGPVSEARTFFGRDTMEAIVKSVNPTEEGGDGLADKFIREYAEVQHDRAD